MTGAELKALRRAMGITQTTMAQRLGISLRGYQDIEAKDDEAIREVHQLAVERIAITAAASAGNPMLAPAAARRDASKLGKLLKDAQKGRPWCSKCQRPLVTAGDPADENSTRTGCLECNAWSASPSGDLSTSLSAGAIAKLREEYDASGAPHPIAPRPLTEE